MSGGFFGLMVDPVSYNWAALLVRLAVGLALLPYGLKKFSHLKDFSSKKEPPEIFKLGPLSAKAGFVCVMLIETFVPICLILGFLTRLAVLPCIFSMAIAFKATKGEFYTSPSSIYLLSLIAIFIIGSGGYSCDYLLMLTDAK